MWENLPDKKRTEYKRMMLAFASITELFAQKADDVNKLAPIINSKYQETVFQKVFSATAEDIGNTSFDVALVTDTGEKYLIGIKTFGVSSGMQKIAQFKAMHDEWSGIINKIEKNSHGKNTKEQIDNANKELYLSLAKKISEVRNQRIKSSAANIRGFKVSEEDKKITTVYHVLMPSSKGENPKIYVGEISYDMINVNNIKICGCTTPKNPANFNFTDGIHHYRYTSADSQLLMDFNNKNIIKESWNVSYVDDAYQLFYDLAEKTRIYEKNKDIKESYSWMLTNHIERFSGFNSCYGVGSKIGIDQRRSKIDKVQNKYRFLVDKKLLNKIIKNLEKFLFCTAKTSDERLNKVALREEIVSDVLQTRRDDLKNEIEKMIYRPKNEVYIPIINARKFHEEHPDFFGVNIGKLKEGTNKLKLPKEDRKFDLVFEPSGDVLPAFITQDNGKAIESFYKQSYLGRWIREGIFQLKEYEPLTNEKLVELGINGLRLYKKNNSNKIHLEFIWIDESNPPNDLIN